MDDENAQESLHAQIARGSDAHLEVFAYKFRRE